MGSSNTTSADPLAYVGIDPKKQPKFFIDLKAPTPNDFLSFELGDQWLDKSSSPPTLYILVSVSNNIGLWKLIGTSSSAGIGRINGVSPDGGGDFGITAGSNITVTPGVNSISIASAAFTWSAQATGTALFPNEGFISTNAGAQSFPLPTASCPIGTVLELTGGAAGLVTITQASGQSIRIGNTVSTTGATGSVASSVQGDALKLVCTVANTTFQAVTGVIGNWIII